VESYDWGDLNSLKVNWPVFKEKMKSGGFSDSELEEYYEKKLQSYKLFSVSGPDTAQQINSNASFLVMMPASMSCL